MSARRAGLLSALLATAALLCALPGLWRGAMRADPNRMDERLRPPRARTLTVWLLPGNVDDRKLLNEACAAFEKEDGGVRVFLRTVDAQELLAPNAVLPDVALLASGSLTEPERAFLPLGGEGEMDASGKSGGVCYAMPLWLAPNVLSMPAEWLREQPTPQADSLLGASEPPQADEITAASLPWRRLLEEKGLALSKGVAMQQLMFACPVSIRGELVALARTDAADGQAKVCTLSQHLARRQAGEAVEAYALMPCVSDRVRYAALCRDGQDARAFVAFLAGDAMQARTTAYGLLPAQGEAELGDALTGALLARYRESMVLPNAFAHTAQEREAICLDAFLRAADPVETLLRLR